MIVRADYHAAASVGNRDFRKKFAMRQHITESLRRLFALLAGSLPEYLRHASLYVRPGDEAIEELLRRVTSEREMACRELADLILERRGQVPHVRFPMRYTASHYLDARYLLKPLVDEQTRLVSEIEQLTAGLQGDPMCHEVAMRILRAETDHLASFEALHAERSGDVPARGVAAIAACAPDHSASRDSQVLRRQSPHVATVPQSQRVTSTANEFTVGC